MSKRRTYWVSYGRTESGDDLQPIIWWEGKPTEEEVDAAYRELMPEEFNEKYGAGMVNHTTEKAVIR